MTRKPVILVKLQPQDAAGRFRLTRWIVVLVTSQSFLAPAIKERG